MPLGNERELFESIDREPPDLARTRLSHLFGEESSRIVPAEWQESWRSYFGKLETSAAHGGKVAPFSRTDLEANAELAWVAGSLLAWRGESPLRFVSCNLCGDSRRLETLRPKLETLLSEMTAGRISSLQNLGILETPRSCLLHGPICFHFPGSREVDFGVLEGSLRVSEAHIARAIQVTTPAARCITVENETTFHELAKLRSGELLVQTSFPGFGTLAFLQRLPPAVQLFHFGDSDPKGFEVLLDLRKRIARPVQSLHMAYRVSKSSPLLDPSEKRRLGRLLAEPLLEAERSALAAMLQTGRKGSFEQETLGRPMLPGFPFFAISPTAVSARP